MSPTFAELGVPDNIIRTLHGRGISSPFEIQIVTIPDALAGRDICGRAPTGSGKTLAFGIPLVAMVNKSEPRYPQGLVLSPTRELALQITNELIPLAQSRKRFVEAIYGGVAYDRQAKSVRRGVDILVATPGRLEDMISRGDVHLDAVRHVVVDEADQLADMGFLPPVRRILDHCHPRRQILLFSATLDGDVAALTAEYQSNPVRHEIGSAEPDITSMIHVFWEMPREQRVAVAARTVRSMGPTIVFVRTRHGADRVARQISAAGVEAVAIHGNRSQGQREKALAAFERGRAEVLVATDVAARGVHVDDVACVIHFDPPDEAKAYVHRSGRTARAGAKGFVISMLQRNQIKDAKRMGHALGLDVTITDPDDADQVITLVPQVKPRRSAPQKQTPKQAARKPAADKPARSANSADGRKRRAGQQSSPPAKPKQSSDPAKPKQSSDPAKPKRKKNRHRDADASKDHGAPKRVKERKAQDERKKAAKRGRGAPVDTFDGQRSSGKSGKGRKRR